MSILLTGHMGFIGSHIYWKLRSMGYEVYGIDRKDAHHILGENPDEYDVIIHTAANLFGDYDENTLSTTHLMKFETGKFIFLSSAAVYGNSSNAKEADFPNPTNKYGRVKLLEETIIQKHHNYAIFRLSNVCGPTSDHGVFSQFVNGVNTINGTGEHVRDFVHVNDVVNMVVRSVSDPKLNGIINIASGKGMTINELFYKLNPNKVPRYRPEKEEINCSVLNIQKAKELGFAPTHFI